MVGNCMCSNPDCNTRFRQLGEGRMFLFPANSDWRRIPAYVMDESHWVGYWLCSRCQGTMTVVMTGSGIALKGRRTVQDGGVASCPSNDEGDGFDTPRAA